MRINKFIAQNSDISRRKADALIDSGKVIVNRRPAHAGQEVTEKDQVIVDGKRIHVDKRQKKLLLLHKPVGYVSSRDGQGSKTVYELLPKHLHELNIAGRLDKDSSGLIILTNDGDLLNQLTHPSNDKEKVYFVTLKQPLKDGAIAEFAKGVDIGDDRVSKLQVLPLPDSKVSHTYEVRIFEGRNRQIRRSFEALGYHIVGLHRVQMGEYSLGEIPKGTFRIVNI